MILKKYANVFIKMSAIPLGITALLCVMHEMVRV